MSNELYFLEAHSEHFVSSRRASSGAPHFGEPHGLTPTLAAIAGGFARLAVRVERWARGQADATIQYNTSAAR